LRKIVIFHTKYPTHFRASLRSGKKSKNPQKAATGCNISLKRQVRPKIFNVNMFFLQEQGRIQDFKLGGSHLKTLRRAEGGAKMFGVFRVKNHDFTPKKFSRLPPQLEKIRFFGVKS
jgi:hypothetical protein